ncbi:MAG: hypothetical protein Q9195_003754 [Heterodermia aff. obscurata]
MSHPSLKEDTNQTLQLLIAQLDRQINALTQPSLTGSERQTAIEKCQAELAHLSNEIKNASFRLPAYDQRLHSEVVKAFNEKIEAVLAGSASKKKFAFKSKSKTPKAGSEAIAENLSKSPDDLVTKSRSNDQGSSPPAIGSPPGTINITGSKGEQVVLTPVLIDEDTPQAAASIYDVQNCTVDLRARSTIRSPLAKLQILNARQTLIICGAVSGSVFLSESQDCVLLATSGQMRVHKCENCAVYLHCTSKPVIEFSDRIKFAPLPSILTIPRRTDHTSASSPVERSVEADLAFKEQLASSKDLRVQVNPAHHIQAWLSDVPESTSSPLSRNPSVQKRLKPRSTATSLASQEPGKTSTERLSSVPSRSELQSERGNIRTLKPALPDSAMFEIAQAKARIEVFKKSTEYQAYLQDKDTISSLVGSLGVMSLKDRIEFFESLETKTVRKRMSEFEATETFKAFLADSALVEACDRS